MVPGAGDEFYSKEWPELEGMTFSMAMCKFPFATPIGIESNGVVMLNPTEEYQLGPGLSSPTPSFHKGVASIDPIVPSLLFEPWRRESKDTTVLAVIAA